MRKSFKTVQCLQKKLNFQKKKRNMLVYDKRKKTINKEKYKFRNNRKRKRTEQ